MYKQTTLYSVMLFTLTACGHSQEDKLATYRSEIANYDCASLDVEERYSTKMIEKLSESQKNYNPAADIAVTVMTLGTDLLPDSASASTKTNLSNREQLFHKKRAIIKQAKQKRCTV